MASLFSREIAEYAVLIFRLLSISRISNFEGTFAVSSLSSLRTSLFQPPALPDYIHRWVNEFRSNNPNLGDIIDL